MNTLDALILTLVNDYGFESSAIVIDRVAKRLQHEHLGKCGIKVYRVRVANQLLHLNIYHILSETRKLYVAQTCSWLVQIAWKRDAGPAHGQQYDMQDCYVNQLPSSIQTEV